MQAAGPTPRPGRRTAAAASTAKRRPDRGRPSPEERASIGDWWYRQEYLCEFVETSDQVFPLELVHEAISDEITPL